MRNRLINVILFTSSVLLSTNLGWAKGTEEQIKDFIDEVAVSLKQAVDRYGEDIATLQEYLDHYPWKGLITDSATSEPATLKHLELNGHGKVVVVRPGERINGTVRCVYDRDRCAAFTYYKVVVGFKDLGPQVTIGHTAGLLADDTLEKFALIAPAVKGIYQVRFLTVEAFFDQTAFHHWENPNAATTIGLVIVQ
jgi:hypothetical protein